jgi:hypothetical protein
LPFPLELNRAKSKKCPQRVYPPWRLSYRYLLRSPLHDALQKVKVEVVDNPPDYGHIWIAVMSFENVNRGNPRHVKTNDIRTSERV